MDDPLTERIIGCAIEVHRVTGAGLLESVYDVCLAYELKAAGLMFRTQCSVPFEYKSLSIKDAFRADFIVEENVLVELKAVETLLPVHKAQVLTYLKLTGLTRGLLLNFNVQVLKDGIRRVVWTPNLHASVPPR
ncbi:MAG TPA: GxxExxY protein [Vicinamibacterales bacterium]|nr:GxxExxY protein [Vicinamibacterales bacterium]